MIKKIWEKFIAWLESDKIDFIERSKIRDSQDPVGSEFWD
jgi:hypothetical protein